MMQLSWEGQQMVAVRSATSSSWLEGNSPVEMENPLSVEEGAGPYDAQRGSSPVLLLTRIELHSSSL